MVSIEEMLLSYVYTYTYNFRCGLVSLRVRYCSYYDVGLILVWTNEIALEIIFRSDII